MVAMPLLATDQSDLTIKLRRLHPLAFKFSSQMITNNQEE
jgi:hypothetical protein